MAKSRDAFRTIGEVAAEMDLPPHVLRFWESKFTQIRPVKRAGGRRYYRPDDINLLAGVKVLLHDEGMTIKGVQGVLREAGAASVMELGAGAIANGGVAPALSDEGSPSRDPAPDVPSVGSKIDQQSASPPAPDASSVLPFPALAAAKAPQRAPKAPPEPAMPDPSQLGLFDDDTERANPRALAFIARAHRDDIRSRARALKPLIAQLEALYDALRD